MSNLGDGKNATCAAKICRGMRHVCMMTVSLKQAFFYNTTWAELEASASPILNFLLEF